MKKYFLIVNILLFAFVSVFNAFYIQEGFLWQKSLASAGFVLIGLINLCYAIKTKSINLKFCITLAVGLIFAMIGDILLEINFIVGAGLFGLGHIIFFISYCFLQKFKLTDLIYGLTLAIVSVLIILLLPIFNFNDVVLKLLCIIYATVISFMVGKATSNLIRKRNLINLTILFGSILFFFSDLTLLLTRFGGIRMGVLCLATYYPAECLLGFSILLTKNKKSE